MENSRSFREHIFPETYLYDKHRLLWKYLCGETLAAEDLAAAKKLLPEEEQFFRILRYLGAFQNPKVIDFTGWLAHAQQAVDLLMTECRADPHSEDETQLLAYGLALRSAPQELYPAAELPRELLDKFVALDTYTDATIWALLIVCSVALEQMEALPAEQQDMQLFLQLLDKFVVVRDLAQVSESFRVGTMEGRLWGDIVNVQKRSY